MLARRRRGLIAIAILGVLAVGGGTAYGTGILPPLGTGSAVDVCVQRPNGQTRIVTSPSQCASNEQLVVLATAPHPTVESVNCGAGKSLQAAIDAADATQPLTISIVGTCAESIEIARDQVTLKSGSPGSGISGGVTVDGRVVNVQDLTISGTTGNNGGFVLFVAGGVVGVGDSHIEGSVHVEEATELDLGNVTIDHCNVGNSPPPGLQASIGAVVEFGGGSISGCSGPGVQAFQGAHLWLDGVTISGTGGVTVETGSSALLTNDVVSGSTGNEGLNVDGSAVTLNNTPVSGGNVGVGVHDGGFASILDASVISGNGKGVVADSGSHVVVGSDGPAGGGVVKNNTGDGIEILENSTLQIGGPGGPPETVTGNGGDGIVLSSNSVANFIGDTTVTNNTGWGVHCDGSAALAQGDTSGVTGNTAGNVDCS